MKSDVENQNISLYRWVVISASKKDKENDILISRKNFNPEDEVNKTESIIKSLQNLNERINELERKRTTK